MHCKALGGGHDLTSVSQSVVQEPLIVCDIKDYFGKKKKTIKIHIFWGKETKRIKIAVVHATFILLYISLQVNVKHGNIG